MKIWVRPLRSEFECGFEAGRSSNGRGGVSSSSGSRSGGVSSSSAFSRSALDTFHATQAQYLVMWQLASTDLTRPTLDAALSTIVH